MGAYSDEVQACIEACLKCHKTCLGMASTHCLETGGAHVKPQHFRLMLDCAAICDAAAGFMLRKSQFHHEFCRVCAKVCEACAEDCRSLDGMESCVEACEACAAHCAAMAR